MWGCGRGVGGGGVMRGVTQVYLYDRLTLMTVFTCTPCVIKLVADLYNIVTIQLHAHHKRVWCKIIRMVSNLIDKFRVNFSI